MPGAATSLLSKRQRQPATLSPSGRTPPKHLSTANTPRLLSSPKNRNNVTLPRATTTHALRKGIIASHHPFRRPTKPWATLRERPPPAGAEVAPQAPLETTAIEKQIGELAGLPTTETGGIRTGTGTSGPSRGGTLTGDATGRGQTAKGTATTTVTATGGRKMGASGGRIKGATMTGAAAIGSATRGVRATDLPGGARRRRARSAGTARRRRRRRRRQSPRSP